ncbi:MAG: hypothetical protein FD143_1479 [Ignavibacteria bacterium]|nr:MAG: hypothetical protein FD143_1479 [Ignavibacteria bacterium]KAF0160529.1 MAG: hypothetical protein FD188_1703 [Ignavibacteria bacterium]
MKKLLANVLFAVVDLVCFLQGSLLLAYSLLHFRYKVDVSQGEGLTTVELQNVPTAVGGYYYYADQYIQVAVIGIGLIITGFLMRSWRKNFE